MQDANQFQPDPDNSSPVYYVGIGASAGGLEALEAFFVQMPTESGMAFIVIQHLSPDYKSMMVELLSKRTDMKVQRAEEGMRVEANSVYLIPPKKNLSIFHGKLLLSESDHSRGLNLPIDVFLRSLADDQTEKAIGIILSGTGSDGVRGIRAIKEAGGMVMVQSEESAKFDGMPRAVITTGLADFILPPDEMPSKLLSFIHHPYTAKTDRPQTLLSDEDRLNRIFALLREQTRVDFTLYKPSTVIRRIERRMTVNQIYELSDYVKFMESYPGEVVTLYRELLIGVTSFFRDRDVFDELEQTCLPNLFKRIKQHEVRFWVAGCSTGEEAFSLAILSREVMEQIGQPIGIKIFATDIDRDAILRASNGLYPESIAADLSPKLLTRYFNHRDGYYQIDRSIREMVVFAQHNLIKDPPFTNIELVSCRNLLIYLQPVLQRKVLELINFSLNPQGILLLGSSETTGEVADLYETLHQKLKIYMSKGKRHPIDGHPDFLSVPEIRPWQNRSRAPGNLWQRSQEEERLLDRFLQSVVGDYIPLSIVVNEQLEVLHILGNPEGYLKLPSGKLLNDITKMAIRDLAIPLATGLQKVFKTGEELKYTSIRIKQRDELKTIKIRILPLSGKKGQELLAAIFIEEILPQSREAASGEMPIYNMTEEVEQRIQDLEQELQLSRENLQATIEELETANEELQATNEELFASNEELQSTNEELQSVNEELHTVNAEYQRKIIELTELNNDLDNLMASTRIGTLFLDENLAVRRFTPEIRRLFKIIDSDVGRPINHLMHNLVKVDLFEMVSQVAQSTVEQEQEVRTQEGIWFLMRILPYQVGISSVSGIVLTFTDIGLRKTTQTALSESESRLASLYRAAPVGIGQIVNRTFKEVNEQICQMVGYTREELIGQSTRLLYPSDEEFEYVGQEKYTQIKHHGVGTVKTEWRCKDGSILPVLLSSSPLNPDYPDKGATFTVLDISSSSRVTEKIQTMEARYLQLFNTLAEGVIYQNANGDITSANPAAEKILGLSIDSATGQFSMNPCWKPIREDGTEFPSDQHPSMIALRTGQAVTDVTMGLFNPQKNQIRWLRISAIPKNKPDGIYPDRVYAIFDDVTEIISSARRLTPPATQT
ncbi:MAG: chemotaxis protein CheR [Candidatus Contendobacter odensis]|uniref:Chemotaxis protein CheR n=1 Tax=Candidatus Contendibacter odensensis TaxID=1400860 RepID=A0A2G6PG05_9GAMM|nr:MAG: chemotaxis protein CheR [Candidatus Contendobacter odensis]